MYNIQCISAEQGLAHQVSSRHLTNSCSNVPSMETYKTQESFIPYHTLNFLPSRDHQELSVVKDVGCMMLLMNPEISQITTYRAMLRLVSARMWRIKYHAATTLPGMLDGTYSAVFRGASLQPRTLGRQVALEELLMKARRGSPPVHKVQHLISRTIRRLLYAPVPLCLKPSVPAQSLLTSGSSELRLAATSTSTPL